MHPTERSAPSSRPRCGSRPSGSRATSARARSYDITANARGTRRDGRTAQTCAFHAQGLEIRIQVVAAGQCVYTLMSMWRGPAPDVDRFLDGFRVLKDCPTDEQP